MRSFINISNLIGAIGILATFSFCIYQLAWNNNLFPYSSLTLFSIIGMAQFIGVILSRKSSIFLYGLISFLNIANLTLLAFEFNNVDFFEEIWKLNVSIVIMIIFISLICFTNKFSSRITRLVQFLILGNLIITQYYLIISSNDLLLYDIILIVASVNFTIAFLMMSYNYLLVKNINTDKSQTQINAEANNLTA